MSRLTTRRFVAAARILAGILAGAVLLFELLAANGAFHESLHHDGKAASNRCVLCLFAKGHVDSAEPAPVAAKFVRSSVQLAPQMVFSAPADARYLVFPSRAPPALLSLPSALA